MDSKYDGRPGHLLSFGLMLLLIFSIFSTSFLNHDYFWDDQRFIFSNPHVLNAPHWISFWSTKTEFFKTWPLGYSIFWFFLKYLPDLNIVFYKCLNLFVHTLNGYLIYYFFKRVRFPAPFLLSLLFVLHPLHVETVSWVFQFSTLLAFLFFMLTVLGIYNFLKLGKYHYLVLAFLTFFLSLHAKSIALFSPFLFVYLFWKFKKQLRLYLFLIPFFGLSLYIGVGSLRGFNFYLPGPPIQESASLGAIDASEYVQIPSKDLETYLQEISFDVPPQKVSMEERRDIFISGVWHYLNKLILPLDQQFIYPKEVKWPIFSLLSFLLVVIVPISLYIKNSSKNYLLIPLLFFVGLLPVLGLGPVHFFYWSWFADRYAYLVLILLPFTCGLLLKHQQKRSLQYFIYIYLLTLVLLNINYGIKFNDPSKLYRSVVEHSPHPVYYNLLIDDLVGKGRLKEASKVLEEAKRIYPSNKMLEVNEVRIKSLNDVLLDSL